MGGDVLALWSVVEVDPRQAGRDRRPRSQPYRPCSGNQTHGPIQVESEAGRGRSCKPLATFAQDDLAI